MQRKESRKIKVIFNDRDNLLNMRIISELIASKIQKGDIKL